MLRCSYHFLLSAVIPDGPFNPTNYSGTQINVWGAPAGSLAGLNGGTLGTTSAMSPYPTQFGFLTEQMIRVWSSTQFFIKIRVLKWSIIDNMKVTFMILIEQLLTICHVFGITSLFFGDTQFVFKWIYICLYWQCCRAFSINSIHFSFRNNSQLRFYWISQTFPICKLISSNNLIFFNFLSAFYNFACTKYNNIIYLKNVILLSGKIQIIKISLQNASTSQGLNTDNNGVSVGDVRKSVTEEKPAIQEAPPAIEYPVYKKPPLNPVSVGNGKNAGIRVVLFHT